MKINKFQISNRIIIIEQKPETSKTEILRLDVIGCPGFVIWNSGLF